MRITKSQLKQLLKEEIEEALKIGGERFTMEPPREPAKEILKNVARELEKVGNLDTISEEEAMGVLDILIDGMQEMLHFGGFGTQSPVKEKKDHPGKTCKQAHPEQEHKEWVVTIAEVSSEKQRRWACAQKDKPASSRKKSLSATEAEEMCKSQVEKK